MRPKKAPTWRRILRLWPLLLPLAILIPALNAFPYPSPDAAYSDLVLAQSSVSDPVDLGTNHIVLIKVKEHLPEALRPLEEVRDQVVEAVNRQQKMEAAEAAANELLASLESGQDMQAIADAAGLTLISTESDRRSNPDVSPRLLQQVFLMGVPGEGELVSGVFETEDGYALVRLDGVTEGAIPEDDTFLNDAYNRRITSATASAEAVAFLRMLRAQSVIEIYEDRL